MNPTHPSIIPHLLESQWSIKIPKGNWILGLRGCVGDSLLVARAPDYENWNCRILLMKGMDVKKMYEATTVPGKPYVQRGLSGKGGPLLLPGVYKYKKGLHKGSPAYNPAQPLALLRNKNHDWLFNPDTDPLEISNPGINLHYGGGTLIKKWSAGCQVANVTKTSDEYKTFSSWANNPVYILVPFDQVMRGSLDKTFRCLMQGSTGELVKKVQEVLKAPITGVYNQGMLKYVQAWQRAKNAAPDTLVGPSLLKMMKV